MFKKLTLKEQLEQERKEKMELLVKQNQLESAVLEIAELLSQIMEDRNNG
jgi:hypothetical protein